METHKFTIASDVWAFGVTVVEIFCDGGRPYDEMENAAVITKVMAGYRLSRPEECPVVVFEMLERTWAEDPEDRPNFTQMSKFLARELGVAEKDDSDDEYFGGKAPAGLSGWFEKKAKKKGRSQQRFFELHEAADGTAEMRYYVGATSLGKGISLKGSIPLPPRRGGDFPGHFHEGPGYYM